MSKASEYVKKTIEFVGHGILGREDDDYIITRQIDSLGGISLDKIKLPYYHSHEEPLEEFAVSGMVVPVVKLTRGQDYRIANPKNDPLRCQHYPMMIRKWEEFREYKVGVSFEQYLSQQRNGYVKLTPVSGDAVTCLTLLVEDRGYLYAEFTYQSGVYVKSPKMRTHEIMKSRSSLSDFRADWRTGSSKRFYFLGQEEIKIDNDSFVLCMLSGKDFPYKGGWDAFIADSNQWIPVGQNVFGGNVFGRLDPSRYAAERKHSIPDRLKNWVNRVSYDGKDHCPKNLEGNGEFEVEYSTKDDWVDEGDYSVKLTISTGGETWEDGSTSPKVFKLSIIPPSIMDRNNGELDFIKRLKHYVTERCQFNYSGRDLIRFHTSVKTGMLTLLGGEPGCGKSSLVELYMRAVSGNKKQQNLSTFKRVDVSPAWIEPADLMGYWTPDISNPGSEGHFHEAPCQLRKFLEDLAKRDKEHEEPLAVVCFEEMNLARIEFYFSEFLQLASRFAIGQEKILNSYGGDQGRDSLTVVADMRIIGTFNDDATTQRMSSRFLDRCNVIELEDPQNGDFFSSKLGSVKEFKEGEGVPARTFMSWLVEPQGGSLNKIVTKLNGLYNKFKKEFEDAVVRPSPRVRKEIVSYVLNRPIDDTLPDDEGIVMAFDEALAQRVVSKCYPSPIMGKKYEVAAVKLKTVLSVNSGSSSYPSIAACMLERLAKKSKDSLKWSEQEEDGIGDGVQDPETNTAESDE